VCVLIHVYTKAKRNRNKQQREQIDEKEDSGFATGTTVFSTGATSTDDVNTSGGKTELQSKLEARRKSFEGSEAVDVSVSR
jgi:hypothetical protein